MHRWSALKLAKSVKNGEISARDIAEHYIKRIRNLDQQVGAFLRFEEQRALEQAERIDAARKRGEPLGLLAGVPIAIKDNLHIKGEITSCGSQFLSGYKAIFDSTVCRLLQEEGAILIGKTNMDEFSMGSTTENSAYQTTRNPWNLACIPGGSSGGSAAAVAAGLASLSLGSDTGGSVRQPAALCGLVGFKPTYGRISRSGLVLFGSSLDQIGVMSRSVEDLALLFEVVGRPCDQDSMYHHDFHEPVWDTWRAKKPATRVGIPWRALEQLGEETRIAFGKSVELLKSLGMEIVDIELETLQYAVATYYVISSAEVTSNLARFTGCRYGTRAMHPGDCEQMFIKSRGAGFGTEVKQRILLGTHVLASTAKSNTYKQAQCVRTLLVQEFAQAFSRCDCIVMPTTPFGAIELGSEKDPIHLHLQDLYTTPASLAGLPAISVPAGFFSPNKPFGLQMIGAQGSDSQLLATAYAFEKIANFYPDNAPSCYAPLEDSSYAQ